MRLVWLIARKEMSHLLNSAVFCLLGLVFVLMPAILLFWNPGPTNLFLSGHTSLQAFFQQLPILLMVFVPALSMRAYAEENRSGNLERLLSFPLSAGQLVLGKFFGCFAILVGCLAATAPFPFLVSQMGDLDWGPVLGGYLGALLLAGSCLAVALFCGAFTKRQPTAFITSVIALAVVMLWRIPALNLHDRFQSVARGLIDIRDLFFYLAVMLFFLFLNQGVVAHKRH